MERVVALPIKILISVSFLFVDLKLGGSIILSDDVYIQYWQVVIVLFLLLEFYHKLEAGNSAV